MTPSTSLLKALSAFLRDDVQGKLSGAQAYKGLIAQNLLEILAREARHGPALALLDCEFAQAHGLEEADMPAALSRVLRDGGGPDASIVLAYLKRRSLLVLQINSPRYASLTPAQQAWPEHHQYIRALLAPAADSSE